MTDGSRRIRCHERRLRREIQRLLLCAMVAPELSLLACTSGPRDDAADGGQGAPVLDAAADRGPDCSASQAYVIDAQALQLADANCFYFVDFPCGAPYRGFEGGGCAISGQDCANICTAGAADCQYWTGRGCTNGVITAKAGELATVGCNLGACIGRRPAGLLRPKRSGEEGVLGRYFAQAAHLEAASVHAFERMREELRAHGAPAHLVRMASRSACDEVRHARVTARIARRYGAEPALVRVRRQGARSLERMARENAIEGCVRETFGAMVATWQARHARDPSVRKSMARIAADETRHAALAWAVASWADARLDDAARARVARARRRAARDLARELAAPVAAPLSVAAGIPSATEAQALVAAMAGWWA